MQEIRWGCFQLHVRFSFSQGCVVCSIRTVDSNFGCPVFPQLSEMEALVVLVATKKRMHQVGSNAILYRMKAS